MAVLVGVLGEVIVEHNGIRVSAGPQRQRAVLAAIALNRGRVVTTDVLIESVWGPAAPPGVRSTLRAYVNGLRAVLEPDRKARAAAEVLRSVDGGYLLDLPPASLDADVFTAAVRHSAEVLGPGTTQPVPMVNAAAAARAESELTAALALWRGEAYAELGDDDDARAERARLDELAVVARELLAVARLGRGRAAEAAADLERDAAQHPYRERLQALYALALVRSGRQAEALDTLRATRRLLADELGLDPGADLVDVEEAILRQDALLTTPTPADAPALVAPPLPAALTPLVGRDDLVTTVTALSSDVQTRLVTLLGPGGSGKTRLSLAVATHLEKTFRDGVWWVDLAAVQDADLVLPAIARTIGMREQSAVAVDEQLARHLAGAQCLIVLDNVEQVVAAAPQLARLLGRCPRVQMLISSRVALRVAAERRVPVPPLQTPDERVTDLSELSRIPAIELLVQRAAAVRPGFQLDANNATAVTEITQRLDGSPLALELAAPWLAVLSPQELLDQLAEPLTILVNGPADLPERQQTIRATIAWSTALIDTVAHEVLLSASVFVGSWDLAAATAVCALSPGASILGAVTTLVEHSLVRPAPATPNMASRFTLSEPVREYAAEQLRAGGRSHDVRARHAEHFRAFTAETAARLRGADPVLAMHRAERDRGNTRAARRFYGDIGQPVTTLRMASDLVTVFWRGGEPVDGLRVLSNALEVATDPGDFDAEVARAEVESGAGLLSCLLGDTTAAVGLLERAITRFRAHASRPDAAVGLAWALTYLGRAVGYDGDADAAEPILREAIQRCEQLQDPLALAWANRYFAHFVSSVRGELAAAQQLCEEALRTAESLDDVWATAMTLVDLGEVARLGGDYPSARARTAAALEIATRLEDQWYIAICLHNLGRVALAEGDLDEADDLLTQSLDLNHRMAHERGISECLAGLAGVALARREPDRASYLIGQTKQRLERIGVSLDLIDRHEFDTLRGKIDDSVTPA